LTSAVLWLILFIYIYCRKWEGKKPKASIFEPNLPAADRLLLKKKKQLANYTDCVAGGSLLQQQHIHSQHKHSS
jgi:hypothetical protein